MTRERMAGCLSDQGYEVRPFQTLRSAMSYLDDHPDSVNTAVAEICNPLANTQTLVDFLKEREFAFVLLSQILRIHHSTDLFTKVVFTASLADASRNASRACSSVTPWISYITRPGWIGATQYSTLPLPLPIRTSTGFLVMGLSG